MGKHNLNSECSKSTCDGCRTRKQKSTANILFCCFIYRAHLPVCPWDESKTLQDSRQVTEQVWSQWDCCLRLGKRMKCFLATAGGHQRVKNRRYLSPAFTTAPNTTYWISPTLSPSLFWLQTVQLFIFTTWPIYKTASWWVLLQKRGPSLWSSSRMLAEKAVTSALGCSASHGSSSSPSLGDTLFYHIHISFIMWPSHSALSPAIVSGIGFYVSRNTSTHT